MDWLEDMQTNLWVFPRGMQRNGGLGAASHKWTSKYGSVVASVYEGSTADGMKEKGLVANLLYQAELKKEEFRVVPVETPNGAKETVHLSLSDPTGDAAILEHIRGKLVIHHGKQYQVMTNSPIYDKQIALNEYWQQIGGTVMLPGTNRAADRFARASFYVNATKQSDDPREAVAAGFSVMRNVSVPRGIGTRDQPNIGTRSRAFGRGSHGTAD